MTPAAQSAARSSGQHLRTMAVIAALAVVAACTSHEIPVAAPSIQSAVQPQRPAVASTGVVPRPVNDDPARLLGLDAAALAELLGTPVRVRRDGTAEIRQFRAGDLCQIDAFLYLGNGVLRVTHYEIRHDLERLDAAAARRCLRTVVENKHKTS